MDTQPKQNDALEIVTPFEYVLSFGIYVRFLGCKHLRIEMHTSRSTTWNTDAEIEHWWYKSVVTDTI